MASPSFHEVELDFSVVERIRQKASEWFLWLAGIFRLVGAGAKVTNRLAEVVNTAEMGYNLGRDQRNSMETLLSELIAWAQTQPEIIALYLYGSQAQGTANTLSDVDVAILAQPDLSQEQLWRLEDRWASQWPERLDLRVLNLAPLAVRYEVMAHGQRLWAADAGIVAEIESLVWRQYWDLHPRLEQDWAQYVEYVTETRNEVERIHACVRQRLQKLEQYINELEKQQPVTLKTFKNDFFLSCSLTS